MSEVFSFKKNFLRDKGEYNVVISLVVYYIVKNN